MTIDKRIAIIVMINGRIAKHSVRTNNPIIDAIKIAAQGEFDERWSAIKIVVTIDPENVIDDQIDRIIIDEQETDTAIKSFTFTHIHKWRHADEQTKWQAFCAKWKQWKIE